MGWFDESRAPPNENEVSDLIDFDELEINQRPDIEEIEALLDGFEIFVNIENVEDFEQEDMFQYYVEDNETMRHQQLKSVAIDEFDYNQDSFYEPINAPDEHFDYQIHMPVQSPRQAEQIFRRFVSFDFVDNLYDNDPQEEIAYEIMELGQLVFSERFGHSHESNRVIPNEEELAEYPKGSEEKRK